MLWGRECFRLLLLFFFFQAEDGIRDLTVTGVQTCALPISRHSLGVPVWRDLVVRGAADTSAAAAHRGLRLESKRRFCAAAVSHRTSDLRRGDGFFLPLPGAAVQSLGASRSAHRCPRTAS